MIVANDTCLCLGSAHSRESARDSSLQVIHYERLMCDIATLDILQPARLERPIGIKFEITSNDNDSS